MNRRDLLLNEMKISQWVLTKPQVLKGDALIRVGKGIKLVVVSVEDHQHSTFFQDLLFTLQLNHSQYLWLTSEQAFRMELQHKLAFLIVGDEQQAVQFHKHFVEHSIWYSGNWQMLLQPQAKRKLWQQIQPYCVHFQEDSE